MSRAMIAVEKADTISSDIAIIINRVRKIITIDTDVYRVTTIRH